MNKRRRYLILLAFGLLAVVVGWITFPNGEPRYHGCPLSNWAITLACGGPHHLPNPQEYNAATNALHQIGTNAIPCLLEWVAWEPSSCQRSAKSLLVGEEESLEDSRLAFLPIFKAEIKARAAFNTFLLLGAEAAPAIPELARLGADSQRPMSADHARRCLWALLMGAQPNRHTAKLSPVLIEALTSPNPIIRETATNASECIRAAASIKFAP